MSTDRKLGDDMCSKPQNLMMSLDLFQMTVVIF